MRKKSAKGGMADKSAARPDLRSLPADNWRPPKPRTYVGFPPKMWFALAASASTERYVSGRQLAFAIENNPGVALPDDFRDYLCRFLKREIELPAPDPTINERFTTMVHRMIERDYQAAL